MKTCAKCKKDLPLSDFDMDFHNEDGYDNRCKICAGRYRYTSAEECTERKEIITEFNAPRLKEHTERIRREEAIISKVASPDKIQAGEALELLKGQINV